MERGEDGDRMTPLEKDIERGLRDKVEEAGGRCLKWVCPGWAGVPDRIVLLPGGRVIFVETKRPKGGVLSARQKWWRRELQRLGFDYYYVYDMEGVRTFDMVLRLEGAGL